MCAFGIDFGTTSCCIAALDSNGHPVVLRNVLDSSNTLDSAVFFESADSIIIGSEAKDMVETDGDRVVLCIKREIGRTDAKPYEFFGRTYNAVEISALILKRLKQIAEEQGNIVDNVVITCPACFGIPERDAIR